MAGAVDLHHQQRRAEEGDGASTSSAAADAVATAMFAPIEELNGTLVAQLGRGGFGVVLELEDSQGRMWAVKDPSARMVGVLSEAALQYHAASETDGRATLTDGRLVLVHAPADAAAAERWWQVVAQKHACMDALTAAAKFYQRLPNATSKQLVVIANIVLQLSGAMEDGVGTAPMLLTLDNIKRQLAYLAGLDLRLQASFTRRAVLATEVAACSLDALLPRGLNAGIRGVCREGAELHLLLSLLSDVWQRLRASTPPAWGTRTSSRRIC